MRKAAGPGQMPPPLELVCLRALWSLGEGRVEDVRQVISEAKPLAYTTVMTILERLARRGAVSRRKVGRTFIYAPELSRETLRRVAVQNLVDTFFEGSQAQLAAFLVNGNAEAASAADARQPDSHLDTALL